MRIKKILKAYFILSLAVTMTGAATANSVTGEYLKNSYASVVDTLDFYLFDEEGFSFQEAQAKKTEIRGAEFSKLLVNFELEPFIRYEQESSNIGKVKLQALNEGLPEVFEIKVSPKDSIKALKIADEELSKTSEGFVLETEAKKSAIYEMSAKLGEVEAGERLKIEILNEEKLLGVSYISVVGAKK
jgi:hypothetical protein